MFQTTTRMPVINFLGSGAAVERPNQHELSVIDGQAEASGQVPSSLRRLKPSQTRFRLVEKSSAPKDPFGQGS